MYDLYNHYGIISKNLILIVHNLVLILTCVERVACMTYIIIMATRN